MDAIAPHFHAHTAGLSEDAAVIALDGKTLRGSLDRFEGTRAAQVLSAFALEERLVLGQIVLEDTGKDHEIQAVQRLIEILGFTGRLYTLDALLLQKKLEAVEASGSDLRVQSRVTFPSCWLR